MQNNLKFLIKYFEFQNSEITNSTNLSHFILGQEFVHSS
jgi:hypothetical protein